jgi:hypothetical protein
MKCQLTLPLVVAVFTANFVSFTGCGVNPQYAVEVSHSGGTDKCGCHYNRKTGEYHCHKRKKRGGGCPP